MTAFPVTLIDVILAGVFLEFCVIGYFLRRRGAAHLVQPLLLFLLSGAFLFLAFRLTLSGAPYLAVGAVLLAAMITHILLLWWGKRHCMDSDAADSSGRPSSLTDNEN